MSTISDAGRLNIDLPEIVCGVRTVTPAFTQLSRCQNGKRKNHWMKRFFSGASHFHDGVVVSGYWEGIRFLAPDPLRWRYLHSRTLPELTMPELCFD